MVWLYTLGSVAIVSLLSLSGAVFLLAKRNVLRRSLLVLISFSVGALLGDVFLHLLPELSEDGGLTTGTMLGVLTGIGAFFVLEKFLHWHHAHIASEDVIHPVAITNLVGDALHNFIDGAIIAGAFLVGVPIGITTTIAVALHEIPQEMGDLGILMHAGLDMRRALLLNFLGAFAAVLGAVLTLLLAGSIDGMARALIAITAGGFVYIAGADLIPELQRETRPATSIVQFGGVVAGVAVMAALLLLE
ncbi:MAG TPA: ZIP family metal transporter [Actinomycetota bacterium]|nr:ZIP family metal transporter [Actinomycetota bacterium]